MYPDPSAATCRPGRTECTRSSLKKTSVHSPKRRKVLFSISFFPILCQESKRSAPPPFGVTGYPFPMISPTAEKARCDRSMIRKRETEIYEGRRSKNRNIFSDKSASGTSPTKDVEFGKNQTNSKRRYGDWASGSIVCFLENCRKCFFLSASLSF